MLTVISKGNRNSPSYRFCRSLQTALTAKDSTQPHTWCKCCTTATTVGNFSVPVNHLYFLCLSLTVLVLQAQTFYSMNFSSNTYTHILTNTETLLCATVIHNDHPGPVPEVQDAREVEESNSTSVFTRVLLVLKTLITVFRASSSNWVFLGVGCRRYPEKCCLHYNFCL